MMQASICRLMILGLIPMAAGVARGELAYPEEYDCSVEERPLRAPARQGSGADEVLLWNGLLLDATRLNRTFPPAATRSLAMAHLAMFDALNSIQPRWYPYLEFVDAAPNASRDAATAAAAHRIAKAVFPAQAADWDAALASSLSRVADESAKNAGITVGIAAADSVLAARTGDGSTAVVTYNPGNDPGEWRPTRPDFLPALLPQWGYVKPFAIIDPDAYVPPPPPPLDSEQWAMDYDEIKMLGEVFFSARTGDETDIAFFWSDPAGSASPPGHWNQIAADFVVARDMDEFDAARTFALLNLAEADAAIVCWRTKYKYSFWRPITAVNLGDTDGNDATVADPQWTPLLTTPRFPDYTSGHSVFSAAAAEILGGIFGRDVPFSAASDSLPENYGTENFERQFESFDAAAHEASRSRILGGIHYRSACEQGLASGQSLAEWVAATQLLPLQCDGWMIH